MYNDVFRDYILNYTIMCYPSPLEVQSDTHLTTITANLSSFDINMFIIHLLNLDKTRR